ncbi:hypothetical protein GQ44DRAFT_767543 [Phaeosphaeriaceae sp. PMI808]|nr:hypothetical protein GQ44DRAFT_767543 [Phaeosphaeriaceae sp. PMI808]
MAGPFRPASPTEDLPAYYQELGDENIEYCFRNFDLERNFDLFDRQTRNPHSNNFCIDFGEEDAFCAFDLDSHSYSKLLTSQRPAELHTRWINIWMPYNQKDLVDVLGQHFDFTPRLLGMMRSDPCPPRQPSLRKKKSSSTLRSRLSYKSSKSGSIKMRAKQANQASLDSEESIGMTELMHSTQLELIQDLSHYQIVNDVWHWSTVDWGRRFVCLGYNSLHNVGTKPLDDEHNDTADRSRDVPHGKRIWNWLLLCEDKTVITVSEDPFPFIHGDLQAEELKMLYTTRRNLVNVFRQLSKAPTPLSDTAMIQLPIRNRIGNSEEETAHRPTDAPGLLFYYLFEDWGTTFNLISRRDHGYGAELDRLRQEMLVKADLAHIDQLHHIGCQLSVLKRVYQSYSLIIDRILKKQEATLASLKNSHVMSGAESFASEVPRVMSTAPIIPEVDSLLGVSLSSAAKVRFERLKDRIMLYALSEIEECIAQKDSLVMMNYNLIAIKESFSVERLTWVTLLLAQITILFTPVTLMTGYFSIQFKDIQFEIGNYWWTFGIVFGVSLLLLFAFSFFSGTFEGKIIRRSWARMAYDVSRKWLAHRKKRGKML